MNQINVCNILDIMSKIGKSRDEVHDTPGLVWAVSIGMGMMIYQRIEIIALGL